MEKNTVITLKLNSKDANRLYEAFKESESDKVPPYAEFQLRPENCVITYYTSGKMVFQGKDAEIYAAPFQNRQNTPTATKKASNPLKLNKSLFPQAGSDEVGTGDFFGPVCVCASYVDETTLPLVEELKIQDSKAMTDEVIREVALKVMEKVPYSLLIVTPSKYNHVHETNNMNAIKAKLHNQAYLNLAKKVQLPELLVVDQFAKESLYYSYLKGEPQIQRGIHFETKAENKYPSVAVASVIARYAFLHYFDQLDEQYDMHFLKGSGKDVDVFAQEFKDKYGEEELKNVCKIHFKNYERLL